MQRKLLQSCDYCRAVNTIKGLLWTGSTAWRSVWREHKSWCVCVCVWAELHWQQPLCISTQASLSPAVEDMQAAGCSSVPRCRHAAMFTGLRLLHASTRVSSQQYIHIQPPDWEDRVGKDESKICFVTNIYHMCMTWHTTSPTRYNHIYSAMLKSGHPLSFWTMMLFYRKFCWCNAVTIIADYDF